MQQLPRHEDEAKSHASHIALGVIDRVIYPTTLSLFGIGRQAGYTSIYEATSISVVSTD